MKLIVGLGNPDKEYFNTYHNLGFMAVENLAESLGVDFNKTKSRALIAEYGVGTKKIILAKPLTYMNLSGESVRELVAFYKIDLKDVVVIYDDYDLVKGAIRIREKGSAGTHNGMRNIVKELGSEDFNRIRIGFKPDTEFKIPLINYVLSGIPEVDKPIYHEAIKRVSLALKEFINGQDLIKVASKYNGVKK